MMGSKRIGQTAALLFALALLPMASVVSAEDSPLAGRIEALKADYEAAGKQLKAYRKDAEDLAMAGYDGRTKRKDLGDLLTKVVALDADLKRLRKQLRDLTDLAVQAQPAELTSLGSRCGPIPSDPKERLATARTARMWNVLNRVIDQGNGILPKGMSRVQAHRYGLAKEGTGVCYYTAIRGLFMEGGRQKIDELQIAKGEEKEADKTQEMADLEAENAALAARIKEIEEENAAADEAVVSDFLRDVEGEKGSDQGPRGTGAGLGGALDAAGKVDEKIQRYHEALKYVEKVKREIEEIKARTRAIEERAARADAEFWADFNGFMNAMGQAAQQQRLPTVPTGRAPDYDVTLEDDAGDQGGDEKFGPWRAHPQYDTYTNCVNQCNEAWHRGTSLYDDSGCEDRCSDTYHASTARVCPKGNDLRVEGNRPMIRCKQ